MKSLLLFFAFFLVLEAVVVQVPLEKRPVSAEQRKVRQLVQHPKGRAVRPHAPGQFVEFDYYNDYFTANITLGTPPQTLTVVLDQTDHQFFVVDASYYEMSIFYKRPYYNSRHVLHYVLSLNGSFSQSSTSKVVDEHYRADYLDGEAQGYTVRDAFSLQGLQVAGQTFGSVTAIIDFSPGGFPVDGVLGLSGSIFGYDSPLQNLAAQLDAPQYTIWIGPHVPPSRGTIEGALTLGGFDSEHCGPLAVQVDQYALDTSFVFEISRVDIGTYSRSGDFYGLQDVSFPFLGLPHAEYLEIYDKLNPIYDYDYGQLIVPCSTVGIDVSITINGVQLTIPGQNYIIDLEFPDGSCTLVLDTSADQSFWLGVPFTAAYCAQMDISTNTVGFAPLKTQ